MVLVVAPVERSYLNYRAAPSFSVQVRYFARCAVDAASSWRAATAHRDLDGEEGKSPCPLSLDPSQSLSRPFFFFALLLGARLMEEVPEEVRLESTQRKCSPTSTCPSSESSVVFQGEFGNGAARRSASTFRAAGVRRNVRWWKRRCIRTSTVRRRDLQSGGIVFDGQTSTSFARLAGQRGINPSERVSVHVSADRVGFLADILQLFTIDRCASD